MKSFPSFAQIAFLFFFNPMLTETPMWMSAITNQLLLRDHTQFCSFLRFCVHVTLWRRRRRRRRMMLLRKLILLHHLMMVMSCHNVLPFHPECQHHLLVLVEPSSILRPPVLSSPSAQSRLRKWKMVVGWLDLGNSTILLGRSQWWFWLIFPTAASVFIESSSSSPCVDAA